MLLPSQTRAGCSQIFWVDWYGAGMDPRGMRHAVLPTTSSWLAAAHLDQKLEGPVPSRAQRVERIKRASRVWRAWLNQVSAVMPTNTSWLGTGAHQLLLPSWVTFAFCCKHTGSHSVKISIGAARLEAALLIDT